MRVIVLGMEGVLERCRRLGLRRRRGGGSGGMSLCCRKLQQLKTIKRHKSLTPPTTFHLSEASIRIARSASSSLVKQPRYRRHPPTACNVPCMLTCSGNVVLADTMQLETLLSVVLEWEALNNAIATDAYRQHLTRAFA